MNEKEIYTQKAPLKSNVKGRTVAFIGIVAFVIALLLVVNFLPYSGILTLVVFALGAFLLHKLMVETVFDITYALYEDKLTFIRKYGKMEWEMEVFPFAEALFYEDRIEHRGKTYEFHPDEKLKELLKV